MNTKILSFLSILAILYFSSCSNSEQLKENIDKKSPPVIATQDSTMSVEKKTTQEIKPIFIEQAYATSAEKGFDIENLFDQDQKTVFKTKIGTGPNEGIMIYFPTPTFVHHLNLIPLKEENTAEITSLFIFSNGQGSYHNQFNNISINQEVSSLFIKIQQTNKDQTRNLTDFEMQETGFEGTVNSFPQNQNTGIENISFFSTATDKLVLQFPTKINGSIQASSTLAPITAYHTNNLFDSHKSSAWVEGSNTSGAGENIIFNTDKNITISKIKIWNGYQRSNKHFKSNCSAKQILFNNEIILLEDSEKPQTIQFKQPITSSQFTLNIKNSFDEGKKYQDLAISELVFFNEKNEPFIINNNNQINNITNNDNIKNILNKSIINNLYDADIESSNKSLIIRDDFTFVYYLTVSTDSGEESMNQDIVMEGNWEINQENGKNVKIKLFGKKHSVSNTQQIYGTNSLRENEHIFTDYLNIKNNSISGGKYIQDFFIK